MNRVIKASSKVKITLLSLLVLMLSSSIAAFALNSENNERIQIVTESEVLEYVEDFSDVIYSAGVKHIINENSEDILDPASVTWHCDNTDVAEIKENGVIIPKSGGKATITAEYQGLKNSIEISVKKGSLTNLELAEKNIKLYKDLKIQGPYNLTVLATTSSGQKYDVTMNEDLQWSSTNENVVKIINGQLIPQNVGKSDIKVSFNGLTATSKVQVKSSKIKKIKLSNKEVSIDETNGVKYVSLKAELSDDSVEDISNDATWETADENIAIAYDGRIDAVGEGITTVTVKYGDFTDKIRVIVKKNSEPSYKPVFP